MYSISATIPAWTRPSLGAGVAEAGTACGLSCSRCLRPPSRCWTEPRTRSPHTPSSGHRPGGASASDSGSRNVLQVPVGSSPALGQSPGAGGSCFRGSRRRFTERTPPLSSCDSPQGSRRPPAGCLPGCDRDPTGTKTGCDSLHNILLHCVFISGCRGSRFLLPTGYAGRGRRAFQDANGAGTLHTRGPRESCRASWHCRCWPSRFLSTGSRSLPPITGLRPGNGPGGCGSVD